MDKATRWLAIRGMVYASRALLHKLWYLPWVFCVRSLKRESLKIENPWESPFVGIFQAHWPKCSHGWFLACRPQCFSSLFFRKIWLDGLWLTLMSVVFSLGSTTEEFGWSQSFAAAILRGHREMLKLRKWCPGKWMWLRLPMDTDTHTHKCDIYGESTIQKQRSNMVS